MKNNLTTNVPDEAQNPAFLVGAVSSSGKCQRCDVNDAQSEHTCPYEEEINGDDYNLCNCCSDCEHECCMAI